MPAARRAAPAAAEGRTESGDAFANRSWEIGHTWLKLAHTADISGVQAQAAAHGGAAMRGAAHRPLRDGCLQYNAAPQLLPPHQPHHCGDDDISHRHPRHTCTHSSAAAAPWQPLSPSGSSPRARQDSLAITRAKYLALRPSQRHPGYQKMAEGCNGQLQPQARAAPLPPTPSNESLPCAMASTAGSSAPAPASGQHENKYSPVRSNRLRAELGVEWGALPVLQLGWLACISRQEGHRQKSRTDRAGPGEGEHHPCLGHWQHNCSMF